MASIAELDETVRTASVFNSYDIVLSNIPEFVKEFREQGHQAEYIKHAFEPRILSKINPNFPKTMIFHS
jgi:hypothetical protein